MDIADIAQEHEEAILTAALASRDPALISTNGQCIWCRDEPVVADTAFCCAECGVDYRKFQREQRQRRI